MSRPCIALLTDFGSHDPYVGVLKGVIARICPEALTIDLTHSIPPGDIRTGAFQLWRSIPYLPEGTIILSVVDPGVGTSRRAVAIRVGTRTYVGPDNGLATYLVPTDARPVAVEIESPEARLAPVSPTFHGRDLFAPAAAQMACGLKMESLGPSVENLVRIPLPRLRVTEGDKIEGEVVHIDGFGNLITSIGRVEFDQIRLHLRPWLPGVPEATLGSQGWAVILPGGEIIRLHRTYGDVIQGEALAVVGSDGLIEMAIRGGSAAKALGLNVGAPVVLESQE